MSQINVLYLYALKSELYFNFIRRVVEITGRFEIIGEKFEYYVNQLNATFGNLNQVYIKYDPNFLTEQLKKADDERSLEFRRLREAIRYQSTFDPDEEKKLAAERLLKITDLYGGSSIATKNMSAKTTAIVNMIEDFEEKNAADVELTGMGGLLDVLKRAQAKFDEIYLSRVEYDAEIGKKVMDEARKLMDEAYRDLVTVVNLEAKRDTEGELTDYINQINVVIAANRTYTGQGQVGSSSSSNSGTDEGTVPVKTATFKFKNGTVVKFQIEVGAPIEAPANTEGYRWKPEVPEFMPSTNKTFTEVPLVEEEATATFHFFDHREEEIKQVVGSALVAPENTAGYYWDPEVPSVMPAEDTSYYEMPEEQQEEEEEEEDNRQEYQITYMDANNEDEFDIQMVKEGDPIVPPTPPTGYHWVDVPEVMPARNIYIRCAADA